MPIKSKPKTKSATTTPPARPAARKQSAKPAVRKSTESFVQAWMTTIGDLGRLKRGSEPKLLPAAEKVKAIFRVNKKSVLELWEVYTQRRDELSRKLISNRAYTVSYLLGFHLANVARAMDLMTRSNKRHFWNKECASKPVRLYDIGCGTGAMSTAYLQSAKATEIFLYDASGPLLDAAKLNLDHLGAKNVRTSRTQIEDLKLEWFRCSDAETVHVYLLGYVWNELDRNQPAKRRMLEILSGHLRRNEKALVFVIEPALEKMSRDAMELREIMCDAGFVALYPCPASAACPMLLRPKDWCYSEGTWQQPEIAQWIDEKLDLDRRRHAGSMYAFASPAFGYKSDGIATVVGRPVKNAGIERYKGHFDYLVCHGEELVKETPKSPTNVILRGEPLESSRRSYDKV